VADISARIFEGQVSGSGSDQVHAGPRGESRSAWWKIGAIIVGTATIGGALFTGRSRTTKEAGRSRGLELVSE
jgi:hypothetical protein